jgi:hypothetical protein
MRLLLFQDATLSIDLDAVCAGINSQDTVVRCERGLARFHVPAARIEHPDTYSRLPSDLVREADRADLSVCCTELPYDNNYFFEYAGRVCILSFSNWSMITSLPLENGLVYFLATFVAGDLFRNTELHERTTGCISDFLGDKTSLDIVMRSAFICASCVRAFEASSPSASDRDRLAAVQQFLNELSRASRANESIAHYWQRTPEENWIRCLSVPQFR